MVNCVAGERSKIVFKIRKGRNRTIGSVRPDKGE